jgi:hypothetical protein
VSLLTELEAFYTEHRRCGDLDGGVEEPVVWFDCECGAMIGRLVDASPPSPYQGGDR